MLRFNCLALDLVKALGDVSPVIARRTTLPVLANVLLETTDENCLRITATNLDLTLSRIIPGAQPDDLGLGAVTVPGILLRDMISELVGRCGGDTEVCLKIMGNRFVLVANSASFSLSTIDADEFPERKRIEGEPCEIAADVRDAIARIRSVISTDETRYILNGVLLKLGQGEAVATDGRRLIIARFAPRENGPTLLVHKNAVDELTRGAIYHKVVALGSTVFFESQDGRSSMWARLIEGNYPNYGQILIAATTTRSVIQVSRTDLVARLRILEATAPNVRLRSNGETLTLRTMAWRDVHTDPFGLAELSAKGVMNIAMNLKWLREALEKFCDETIALQFIDSHSPIQIENESLTYVQMPIRMSTDDEA